MSTWVDSATLIKVKGNQGRFVARCAPNLSFIPEPETEVAFVPPQLDAPRRGVVASAAALDDASYEVAFCGIESRGAAEALLGCHCLVLRADLPPECFEERIPTLEGFTVLEGSEAIGTVEAVIDNPGQLLLSVARPGKDEPVLIPLVDDFLEELDEQGRIIVMRLPQGLLDLSDR